MSLARILIVEDESVVARHIAQQLTLLGYEPVGQTSEGRQAIDRAEQLRPDLVLMDIQLAGDMDGIAAAEAIRDRFAIPVVFLTALRDDAMLERAKVAKPFGFIVKPFQTRDLHAVIEMALHKHHAEEALREREDIYSAIVRQAIDGIVLVDIETLQFVEFNDAACEGLGYTREEFAALRLTDVQAILTPQEVRERIRELVKTGGGLFENQHRRKDGKVRDRHVSNRIIKIRGRAFIAGIWADITQRKAHEREIERLNRLYSALSELNQTIARIASREELFREVCRIATERTGFKVAWIGWPDPDTHQVKSLACAGEDKAYVDKIKVYADDRPEGRGPTGTCLREGRTCIFNDFFNDPLAAPWHAAALAHGLRAVAALPICFRGDVCGALTIYDGEPNVFQEKEIALLEEAAAAISLALESMDREARRKRAEEEILLKNTLLATQQEASIDGILAVDAKGKVILFNRRLAEMWNIPREMVEVGDDTTILQWVAPQIANYDTFLEKVRYLYDHRRETSRDEVILKDGRTFDRYSAPMFGSNDQYLGRVWYFHDITDSKQAEEALRQSEQRYRSLFDHMLDGFAYCKMLFDEQDRPVDFVYLAVNDSFERLTGLKNVVGKRITELLPGVKEASPEVFDIYGRVALTGKPENFEIDFKPLNAWLSISVYSIEKGTFVAVFDNITERKRAEEVIRASEAKYRRLHETMRDAFGTVTLDGRFRECKTVYREMLGYTLEELRALTYVDLTPEKWHAIDAEIVATQVLQRGYSDIYEKEYRRKDGSVFPVELRVVLQQDGAGQPYGMWATVRDITERKRAEQALQAANQTAEASRAQFEQVVSMISDIVWRFEVDCQDTFIGSYISPVADRLLGLPPGTIGNNFETYISYVHPEDSHALRELFAARLHGLAKDTTAEYRLRKPDGTILWVRSKGSAYPQPDGHIVGFGTTSDITERKLAEESLRQSERHLKEAQAMAHLGRWQWDVRTGDVEWSEEVFSIFQLDPAEFTPHIDAIQALSPWPEDHDRDKELIRRATENHEQGTYDQRFLRPDKSIGHYHSTFQGKYDDEGNLVSIVGTVLDVTERKRAEEELRQSEEMYRSLVENIDCGITLIDCNYNIITTNSAQSRLFDKTVDQFRGRKCYCEFEKRDVVCPHCPGAKALATHQPTEVETVGVRDDGSHFDVRLRAFPLFGSDGAPTGFIELVEDITQFKETQKVLHQAKEAAEAANRAKSAFLANMSHEIRTPMTAILGHADLMLDEDIGHDAREHISIIKRNGEHLLKVIGNILDLSKIEAEKLDIECACCSPVHLVAEVVSLMRPQAAAKHLRLRTELTGPLPETVLTDPMCLRQVLVNLLGNAIKFTDEGEVRLAARLVTEGGAPRLKFDVVDTGIGMNEEQVGKLFQPFMQVDSSPTRRFGGTGLGLCISKHLAEAMGGDIEVRSAPGIGSTFSVTIDPGPLDKTHVIRDPEEVLLDRPQSAMVTTPEKIVLHGRILLAEDGLDNQRLISLLLRKAGADVTSVENGQLAVDAALAAREQGKPFDVILMDMQMSVMDGYTATRQLRRQGYTAPVIALTAHAMSHDSQKCLDAGCDAYAAKPIDRQKLLATVAEWMACDSRHDSVPDSSAHNRPTGATKPSDFVYSRLAADAALGRLIDRFVREMPDRIDTLDAKARNRDWRQLAEAAHQLKGAAGDYGFDEITSRAARLEDASHEARQEQEILSALDALIDLCRRVRSPMEDARRE